MLIIFISAFVDTNVVVLMINLMGLAAEALFCIPIGFHNFGEFQSETLLIVFGLIKRRTRYHDILVLTAANNPLSSLSQSLGRIEIKCRGEMQYNDVHNR